MLTLNLFTHVFSHFASNSCHRACYIHISWLCKAIFAIQTKFVTGATTVEACLMCQAGHFSTAAGHHSIIRWSEYSTLKLRWAQFFFERHLLAGASACTACNAGFYYGAVGDFCISHFTLEQLVKFADLISIFLYLEKYILWKFWNHKHCWNFWDSYFPGGRCYFGGRVLKLRSRILLCSRLVQANQKSIKIFRLPSSELKFPHL